MFAFADWQVGDRFTISAKSANLKAGTKTIAQISQGQEGIVEKIQGVWILSTFTIEGRSTQGWLHEDTLTPPPQPVPQEPKPAEPKPATPQPAKPSEPEPKTNPQSQPKPRPRSILNSLGTLRGHTDDLYCLAFSADEKTLVTAGADKAIFVWDVAKRQPLKTLLGHQQRIRSLAFSPVMPMVLVSGGGQIDSGELKIWNVRDEKLLADLPVKGAEVTSVGFSADGTELFTAGWSSAVTVWELITARAKASVKPSFGEVVQFFAVSPSDELLAAPGKSGLVYLQDISMWREPKNTLLETVQGTLAEHTAEVVALAFSGDGQFLATAAEDQSAIIWDVKSGRPVQSWKSITEAAIQSIALSPDGRLLAVVSANSEYSLTVWDVSNGQLRGQAEVSGPVAVAFSPSGRLLACAAGEETRLWSVSALPQTGSQRR